MMAKTLFDRLKIAILMVVAVPLGFALPADAQSIVDFSKAFSPDTLIVGGTSTLTFTVTNNDEVGRTSLAFTDNLPAGLVVATPNAAADGCAGTLTATSGSGTISYSGGTVAAGASCSVSVDVTGATAGTMINTSGALTSDLGAHGTATDTLIIEAPGTIIIVKDAVPDDPEDFNFSHDIDEGASFMLDDDADGTLSNTQTFTNVPPGFYSVGETVPNGWVFDDGTSSCDDLNSSFDGETAFISLEGGETVTCTFVNTKLSNVGFSKFFLPDTIGPGSTAELRFDIDNSESPTPVTDLAFTDVLPAGITIATPASAFTDCASGILSAPDGGTTISLTDGELGADEACSVAVSVVGTATATNVSGSLTSSGGTSGAATATLTVDAGRLGITKDFAPGTIPLGGTSELTLTLTNDDAAAKSFVTLTDPLPAGMVIATPANVSNTCGGTLEAVPGTSVINLFSGSIAGMSSCTITVDVTTETTGVFVNTTQEVEHGFPSEASGGFATATLDVPVEFLSKVFLDDPVPPGGTVTLEFTINNLDRTSPATNISFDDVLDPLGSLTGLAPAASESLPKPACGGTLDFVSGTTLRLTGGSLPAAGSCSLTVALDVPVAANSGTYTNTTTAVTATIDGEAFTGNMATDNLVVSVAPIFTKEFIDDPAASGGPVTLRFTIKNNSPDSSLTGIEFTDDLNTAILGLAANSLVVDGVPDPLVDPCGEGSELTVEDPPDIIIPPNPPFVIPPDPTQLIFIGGNLAAAGQMGDSCTFDVVLDVPDGVPAGIYTNTTSDLTGYLFAEVPITGLPAAGDLQVIGAPRLLKEFTDDPVEPGSTVTLEFTLTHDEFAPGDATDISFTDDLAAALSGLTATGLPLSDLCGPGNGTLTGMAMDTSLSFSGASLAPGETCTFSVALQVPDPAAAGSHLNTTSSVVATVDGVQGVTGNPASDDLKISGLTLTKEFTDDPVLPGDTVTLEFVIENVSPSDTATSITIRDDMATILGGSPDITGDGVTVADVCGPGNGTVEWTSGNTFMTFSGGTLAPGEMCTFSVVLDVPAAAASGTYVNSTGDGADPGFIAFMPSIVAFEEAVDELVVTNDLLFLTKEFTDDPVAPGGTATLEFTLTNLADEAVSEIKFTDDLDAALAGLVATGLPISACGGTVSTPDGGSTVELTGGSLAAAGLAGDSCAFEVTLSVPSEVLLGATVTNITSEVTGLLPSELEVTGGSAIDELRISNLEFTKAFDGPAPAAGTTVLTFSIENLDASEGVSDIEFSDDLDLVVPGLEATGLPVNDVCGPGSVLLGTSVVSLGGASLGPGASCTFDVALDVPATAAPATYTNITGTLFVDSVPVGIPAIAELEIVSDAAIEMTKTPAFPQVQAGSTATFTIAMRNLGSVVMTKLAVSDPLTPACDRTAGELPSLAPGGAVSYSCETAPLFADLTNEATATADIPSGLMVTASTTGLVQVIAPVIEITKTPAEQQILAGETATFTITLTNIGTTGLTDILVSDLLTPDCDRSGGEGTPQLPDLEPGQNVSYDCTTEPLGIDLVNVASVSALTREGQPVNASASALVEVIAPIEIIKSPAEQQILAGETATFTITLTNPGSVEKTDLAVSDPLTPDCDATLASLAAGGTFSYTCTTDPLFADLTNRATVTADTPAGPVEANSSAYVDVVDPTVEISKTPDIQLVLPGQTASFTITVMNPGSDVLTDVAVSDPLSPDCDANFTTLPAGGSESYSCSTDPLFDDFTNVATVTATSVAGPIEASTSAHVNVRNPIEIIKAPADQSVEFGGTATFTITVINDGDSVLTDVAVSDPLAPDCDRAAGVLGDLAPAGGQVTYTCSTDALVDDLVNQATVTAQGSQGTVNASDSAFVDVLTELQITKTPADQQLEAGSSATFTITVTNGGTESVTGVVVADPLTPACDSTVGTLDPGALTSYDCTTDPLFDNLVNVATATGQLADGTVTATATARVEVSQPLVITKEPEEQEILAGGTADFTITVSNPSQVTRTNVAVSDPLTPSCDRAVGVLGDLGPGEATSYDCTTEPLFADLTNVATATGEGPAGTVTAMDSALVIVTNPEIDITKIPEIQVVSPGAAATFTITINNPGPGGLTDIAVSDPLTPDCDRAAGTLPDLPAGTSTSYDCQTGPLSADFINVATVTATSDAAVTVNATASATVNVRNPIEIVKQPFEQQVPQGTNAAFVITITNDGDTVKTDVAVSDPLSPDCDRAAGTVPDLAPDGGSFTYACQSEPVFADFVNLATVTADSSGGPVEATDTAAVIVLRPDFGDAPAPYPTLFADDGARHGVSESPFFLGTLFDTEADGQPDADATGDDGAGIDDEDGIAFSLMAFGEPATADVTVTGAGGLVNAWIDFSADGDWNDPGEHILTDVPVVAGANSLAFAVPIDAVVGSTFARFRLDSGGGLQPTGSAADGEVEDYRVDILRSLDIVPPTVDSVGSMLDTGDGSIDECETAQVKISRLLVTFSESVDDPSGDADPDDVTNPANYLVLAAGPDADFTTTACGAVFGDDVHIPIVGVSYDDGGPTATLELSGRLPSGQIRLLVCGSTSIQDLGGNPLDGDGNGTGGDDFVLTFRSDPANLFANGHFDCDTSLWALTSATPGEIFHSTADSDGSSVSGSLEFMQLGVNTSYEATQCVSHMTGGSADLSALSQVTADPGVVLSLTAFCESFAGTGCSGQSLGNSSTTAILGDSGGAWLPIALTVAEQPGSQSKLCSFAVRAPTGDDFILRLDQAILEVGGEIFADGFESGDTTAWSTIVGGSP